MWISNDFTAFCEKPNMQSALIVISSVESFNTQIAHIESQSSFSKNTNNLRFMGWLNHIKNLIKFLSAALWNLITRILNLKSWAISGALSGSFFGMVTGSMQLQLIFEK